MPRIALILLLFVSFVRADEYDVLRLKWRDIIVGTGYDTADTNVASRLSSIASTANSNWSSMDKSPTRTFLWSDLASTTDSSHITGSYQRLRDMALAYATPGCSLAGNATLVADIVSGLDWMYANRYGATTKQYFNWWDWEIGSPMRLTDICVLLYEQINSTQLTNYMNAVNYQVPIPDMTQANKVWKARAVGMRGCLVKDSAKLVLCRDAFSSVFPYVTAGDGYYTDGSFIQHDYHPYTAGYGSSLIGTMAPTLSWLSGSTWAVTDPAQNNLFRWVFDSYEPIIYNGNVFDLVRGREAGRAGATPNGNTIMDSILQIAQFAPPADAARMKSMIKEWALADYTRNFVAGRGLPTLTLAKQLINDPAVIRRGELIAHYTFGEMDRVIHLGAGYGFGLTLCSTRVANFESINGENLRGWFTGDGQTTLYNGDLFAFADSYWATVDQYRLPGVTADVTHVKLPHQSSSLGPRGQGQSTRSPHSWVGGATLGKYGAAGMQFKGVGVTLTGKKSWFMFDDEIVCLGAGITSTDSRPIETTIEQRKINTTGNNAFTVNGTAKSTTLDWTETMSATSWAHLAGNVSGSDIGYYFPTDATVKATREARTGAWSDIEDTGSTTPITRNYLRMTFEHGNNPSNATYQYVLLPGRNATRTRYYAAAPQITVLANNTNVQAVTETTLGITAASFWTDTSQTIGGITSNKKASVLVRDDGAFIDVSVSDPTQLNTTTIALQIAFDGGTLVSADAGITVTQITPNISISVSTASAGGKTFKARFYKLTPQTVNLTPVADSYVHDATASVNSNFGTETSMPVKKSGAGLNREGFLRFDLPAGNGLVLGGTLKLDCLNATTPGVHGVAKVDDNTWSETGITWNNKPAAGSVLDTWTPAALATTSANVSSALPASGLVSFKVAATTETSDGFVTYGTKENTTAANRPQLSLSYGHTPPDVSITTPADGAFIAQAGNVTITADAVPTDGAITSVAFYDGATLLGTDTSAPYSITPSFTGGPHFLKAVATDANGLSRTSFTTRFDIGNPPAIKAATGSVLNLASAWTDVFVPVNPDTATWNANSLTGTMSLGAALNWGGLIVSNPSGQLTFNGTQTLTLGSGGIDMSVATANLTMNHPVLLGGNQTWDVGAGRTLAANGQILGSFTLTKAGTGDLTLSGANTYSGTILTAGTISVTTNPNALGSGNVTFNGGTRLTVDGGLNAANNIIIGSNTGEAGRGLLESSGTGTATYSGNITINNAPSAGGHFASTSGNDLVLSGVITSSSSFFSVSHRNGTVAYSGGGTGYGNLFITGTAKVGATNGIATTGNLTLGTSGAGTLDLNGFNQGLVGITKGPNAATIGSSSTTANSVLTTTGTSSYAGIIQNTIGSGNRTVSLAVASGTLTLSGNNTYTGGTTITGGTLALGANSTLPTTALSIGNATLNAATFTDTIGTLAVNGSAAINLGSGAALTFSSSNATSWTGTLTLTGTFVSGSSLRFGTSNTSLTSTQLSKISASGFTGFALNSSGYLTATATAPGFATWITGTFANGNVPTNQRGPNDDPDNDGIRNLVEYAIAGQDPTVANATLGSFTGTALSFTKRMGTTGLTYVIQQSTDLGITNAWAEVTGGGYVNNATTISYTFTPGTLPKIFLRLQVTQAP